MDCSYESPRKIRPSPPNDFGPLKPINDLKKSTKSVYKTCKLCLWYMWPVWILDIICFDFTDTYLLKFIHNYIYYIMQISCIHLYIYIYICVYVCKFTYIHTFIFTYIHIQTSLLFLCVFLVSAIGPCVNLHNATHRSTGVANRRGDRLVGS